MTRFLSILVLLFLSASLFAQTPIPGGTNFRQAQNNFYIGPVGGQSYLQGVKALFTDSIANSILLSLSDSSNRIPTTKWIKQQGYGTGSGVTPSPDLINGIATADVLSDLNGFGWEISSASPDGFTSLAVVPSENDTHLQWVSADGHEGLGFDFGSSVTLRWLGDSPTGTFKTSDVGDTSRYEAGSFTNQAYVLDHIANATNNSVLNAHVDSVGNIVHYNWNNPYVDNTVFLHIGSASSVSTGTGGTNIDSGKVDFSQYIIKLGNYFSAENFTIRQKLIIVTQYTTDVGLGLGLPNALQIGGVIPVFHLRGDTGYVSLHSAESLASSFASNRTTTQFKLAIGDTVVLEVQRRRNVFNATMYNLTNGISSTLSYTYPLNNTSPPVLPALSFYKIYQLGGHFKFIDSLLWSYDEPQFPEYAFMGNSVETGYGASLVQYRNATVLTNGYTNSYVVNAGPSERAADAEARMSDFILHFKPTKALLFEYGVNDVNGSDNRDSASARYTRALTMAKNAGIYVVGVSPFPQATSVQWMIDTMQAICTRLGFGYINDYPALKSPTGVGAQTLYTTDGVHPNDLGHGEKASVDRDLLQNLGFFKTMNFTITLPTIPNINNYKKIMVLDDSNRVSTTDFVPAINIYNSDGTLTGNRTVTGTDLSVTLSAISGLLIKSTSTTAVNPGTFSGFVYHASKAALTFGTYGGAFRDDASVGVNSFAGCASCYAYGEGSINFANISTNGAPHTLMAGSNNTDDNSTGRNLVSGQAVTNHNGRFGLYVGNGVTGGGNSSWAGGGNGTTVSGDYSFAFGDNAQALYGWNIALGRNVSAVSSHLGAMVLGDYGGGAISSWGSNTFTGRFSGGWRFYLDNATIPLTIDASSNIIIPGAEAIGTASTPNASAVLDLVSTTKGLLPPRMTSAQRAAISSPPIGLIVYQTDATEGLYVNTSGGWIQL